MIEAGKHMRDEIAEQPEVWARILGDQSAITRVVGAIHEAAPRFVVFIARGTSDHAALYGKYLAEVVCGLPAGSASPSTATLYDSRQDMHGVLVIALSQSGGSPDLTMSLRAARAGGALTVAITNNPESSLASEAHHHIALAAGPERSVAATKSYTAELLVIGLLFHHLAGIGDTPFRDLPALGAGLLDDRQSTDAIVSTARRFAQRDRFVTVARGYSTSTAYEAALKLTETNSVMASGFSAADLQHGPLAMIDSTVPVLVIASASRSSATLARIVETVRVRAAPLFIVGGRSLWRDPDSSLALPVLNDASAPIVDVLPFQMLAREMALLRGLDPDHPKGLSKVTLTT